MHKYLVIYHGNCFDGFTAAWIARKFLPNPDDIVFHSGVYGCEPPWKEIERADRVFILDFSYPRDVMIRIASLMRDKTSRPDGFLVLDHHISAQKDCEGLDFCRFDMEQSGAGLAWQYFSSGKQESVIPNWIEMVEDRDLWRFNYGGTKAFHAYMASYEMTFENWDAFDRFE